MPNFRSFGGKSTSGSFRALGGKHSSSMYDGFGGKGFSVSGSKVVTVPHTLGMGGMSDGSYMAGNTYNAVANGLNDRRAIPSFRNADAAGSNQLERQSKRQKGGM